MELPDHFQDHSASEVAIISGTATFDLALKICASMRLPITRTRVGQFSDGEIAAQIKENVRGRNVFIIQSVCGDVNRSLMELILLTDAARRSSAREIVAVAPYLGYSRQDRRPRSDRVPISAKVVADMLGVAGISRLVSIDIHSEQIQGFYRVPVDNLYASPVMLADISRRSGGTEKLTIVSPDVGGVPRARAFATELDVDLAIIDKRRPAANVAKVMHVIGDVDGRDCILVDDIVDTAGSLTAAAAALRENGAATVRAYCTHPVLSGDAVNRIEDSALDELVVSSTIPVGENKAKCGKIRSLDISELLAEALMRIISQASVSSLFIE